MTRIAPILRRPNPHHSRVITVNAHPLARQFFAIARREGVAITDIAERAGLGLATLVKWKYRHAPTVSALTAALNTLDYDLRIVKRYRKGGE